MRQEMISEQTEVRQWMEKSGYLEGQVAENRNLLGALQVQSEQYVAQCGSLSDELTMTLLEKHEADQQYQSDVDASRVEQEQLQGERQWLQDATKPI